MKKLIRDEQGQAFILVLIMLLVGGLTITPLLSYMSTGLVAGQANEERMYELYAADAGVEDAIWQIKTNAAGLPGADDDPWEYSIGNLDGKEVNTTIAYVNGLTTYKITSIAASNSGTSITIESYVVLGGDFSYLLDNAVTSIGDVTIKPGAEVTGKVHYNGELDNKGDIDGEIMTDEIDNWPTAGQLSDFYWEHVKDLDPYPDDTIDLKDADGIIESLYRDGDLTIINTGGQTTAMLEGTIYVTGDLVFQQPGGPKAYTIDLSGQTIYVEGSITFPAIRVTLSGSGCIIAVGDVTFQPDISSEEGDFIFVMSVEGEVWFSPQASFYGSVAGVTDVDLQPNCTLEWGNSSDELNFPGVGDIDTELIIRTWKVII